MKIVHQNNKALFKVTDSNEDVAAKMKEAKKPNATLIAFEKLRDTAVENLCKALRAGMRTHEKDIVKALIFSVSNRLYTQDKAKDAQLMSQNTILTLGHIAVALRHEEKVTFLIENIFSKTTRRWPRTF